MNKLALHGGSPVRSTPFPDYVTIGEEEKRAALEVLESGVLSKFLGTWSPDFFGGPRVQQCEREWAEYFGVKHVISVNSATSGLYAAAGAAGIGPGDEVIVSPYTMIASATAALVWGATPVFADIDPETFCLSPESIRQRITPRTKAIIAVDIFGHPVDADAIMAIAAEHNLIVIEDTAQAIGAKLHDRWAGTLTHIGVFSLNYHKIIHSGEGGMVVTNDDALAERVQLIRNHAEAVADKKGVTNFTNMIGQNYRMTEIEAAIAGEQLKKLDRLVPPRIAAAQYLDQHLAGLPGLTLPRVRPGARHVYYNYAIRYAASETGVPREHFVAALKAEGLPVSAGYVRPIYLEPMYQQRQGFGSGGFPFAQAGPHISYDRGLCPVTERMHFEELISVPYCHAGLTERELADTAAAFHKVCGNLAQLQ